MRLKQDQLRKWIKEGRVRGITDLPKTKKPQAPSLGEETLAQQIKALKLPPPERELLFHPERKWRFDFAYPTIKIAVEVEGSTLYGRSRHSKGEGFENDCRKYNFATLLGWRVFRFSTAQVISGEAIELLEKSLRLKEWLEAPLKRKYSHAAREAQENAARDLVVDAPLCSLSECDHISSAPTNEAPQAETREDEQGPSSR